MKAKENNYVPDYEHIAGKIVTVLFESGVTYRESEQVLEYVRGMLWEQRVQDSV